MAVAKAIKPASTKEAKEKKTRTRPPVVFEMTDIINSVGKINKTVARATKEIVTQLDTLDKAYDKALKAGAIDQDLHDEYKAADKGDLSVVGKYSQILTEKALYKRQFPRS